MGPVNAFAAAGDTVRFKAKFEDQNGIDYAYMFFGNSSTSRQYISLTLNGETGFYEGEYTFTDTDPAGAWYISDCSVSDPYGFYTTYSSNSKRVMQRFFPGYIYLNGDTEETAAGISNIVLEENGKTLNPGDLIHFSFDLPAGFGESLYVNVNFSGPTGFSLNSYQNQIQYDTETGHVTGSYSLTADMINGSYRLQNINASANGWSDYKYFSTSTYSFTFEGGIEPDVDSLSLTDISSPEDGMTLTDGEKLRVFFRVNPAGEVSSANVSLRYQQADKFTYGSGINQYATYSRSTSATLNESTGLYEAIYTFGDQDLYGVYDVSVEVKSGSVTVSEDNVISVLFAENKSETFQRLSPATDLKWDNGYMTCTLPADHQGQIKVEIVDANGNYVHSITYNSYRNTDPSLRVDDFLEQDVGTGDYYFTVTMLGDNKTYYNSETVKSDAFHYVMPTKQLGLATSLVWIDSEDGNTKIGSFKMPADNAYLRGYEYRLYYSETKNGTPVECNIRGSGGGNADWDKKTGTVRIWDNVLQTYGSGYYYYDVRTLTNNVLECRSGEWSGLSTAYHVAAVADSVATKLSDVETTGKSPTEIKAQVQQIPTEELKQAMLSDESVVDRIRELEAAAGARTLVSKSMDVPGLEGSISAVGAGLNTTVASGDVTLSVGRAESEHVLPSEFDNTIAVGFSMGLNNVEDAENLTVPVLIDIPVPSSIEPSFLIILHYHAWGGEPEQIYPYTYRAGNQRYAQFALTSFSDFVLTERLANPPKDAVIESNDYVLLHVGQTATLTVEFDEIDTNEWYVTDTKGITLTENSVVELGEDGAVKGLSAGTVYVVTSGYKETVNPWGWKYNAWQRVRVRIDVVEEELEDVITQVSLPVNKATVEIYSTDYTAIPVLLEMDYLKTSSLLTESEIAPVLYSGVAIDHAAFTSVAGGTAAGELEDLFDLVVEGDRTLRLVPKYEKLTEQFGSKAKIFKSSYKTGLTVTVAGKDYPVVDIKGKPAVLTLSVKQSMPKIKASALTFTRVGTSTETYSQRITFTGGRITDLELPGWLQYMDNPDYNEENYSILTMVGQPPAASGKLSLKARVMGWAVDTTVTISYSVKTVAPDVSFYPSQTITLRSGGGEQSGLWVQVNSRNAPLPYDENSVSFTCPDAVHVEKQSYNQYSTGGEQTFFWVSLNPDMDDGKAHTYKIEFNVYGKKYPVTVKVVSADTAMKLSLKQNGGIEVLDNQSLGEIRLVKTLTNAEANSAYYGIVIRTKTNPTNLAAVDGQYEGDGQPLFQVNSYGDDYTSDIVITAYSEDTVIPKDSYIAEVTANQWNEEGVISSNTVTVPLSSIKWAAVKRSVTVTSTNYIDTVHPGYTVGLQVKLSDKSTLKSLDSCMIKFYDGGSALAEEQNPFEVIFNGWNNNTGITYLTVRLKGAYSNSMYTRADLMNALNQINSTHKYTMVLTAPVLGKDTASKAVKITTKMGKVTASLSRSTVELLEKDRFSTAEFWFEGTDGNAFGFNQLRLDPASEILFKLIPLANGKYAIGFANDTVPGVKAGQTKTAKILVTAMGNNTGKPNLTLSLKVQIK